MLYKNASSQVIRSACKRAGLKPVSTRVISSDFDKAQTVWEVTLEVGHFDENDTLQPFTDRLHKDLRFAANMEFVTAKTRIHRDGKHVTVRLESWLYEPETVSDPNDLSWLAF